MNPVPEKMKAVAAEGRVILPGKKQGGREAEEAALSTAPPDLRSVLQERAITMFLTHVQLRSATGSVGSSPLRACPQWWMRGPGQRQGCWGG